MKKISVHLTLSELEAVVTLASDQMFRVKYIDPKMPGYVADPVKLSASKAGLQVLQDALDAAKGVHARTSA